MVLNWQFLNRAISPISEEYTLMNLFLPCYNELRMKKPEVVILHGWAISAANKEKWHAFRSELQSQGIKSTFLPLPGLSTELTTPWSLQNYVEWLEHTLADSKEVILLGHSFGGQLAVRYTAQHQSQIAKLILVASAGVRDYSLKARSKRAFFYLLAKLGFMLKSLPVVKKLFYKLVGEHDYESAPPVMKETMRHILADEIREDLYQVHCPVQLVWGTLDTITPFKTTQLFLSRLSNARLCSISSARHSPQFTHSDKVAACVAEFLLP